MAKCDFLPLKNGEKYEMMRIRFRTIGDMSCTGATISNASTVEDIIKEVAASRITERGGRADDRRFGSGYGRQEKRRIFLSRWLSTLGFHKVRIRKE